MKLATISPTRCIEWFVISNLAFLGLDIAIAHQENGFREHAEWVPIAFSAIAPFVLVPGALRIGSSNVTRTLDLVVAAISIVVGVLGMVFHLESAFFEDRTLRALVYSAPFVAPLAYVGVGLLLALVRLEKADSIELGRWTLFLALGGCIGNLGLSLLDHAQNGFFDALEWIPVVAAAFACGFLGVALVDGSRLMLRACLMVCAVQAIVGFVGFVLHMLADAHQPAVSIAQRFIHGAPAFAPLLFTNIAVLAAIGIWILLRAESLSLEKLPESLERVEAKDAG
jgi:hypothetical protein